MEAIQLGTSKINYQIIRSNRKTVGFEVHVEKGVLVRAPQDLSEDEIAKLVKKKADWILQKQERIAEIKDKPHPKEYLSGEKLPYIGRRYRLKVKEADIIGIEVKLYQGKFQIKVSSQIKAGNRKELIREEAIKWYKNKAKLRLKERVEKYKNKIGKEPNSIKIKNHKSRWGSCSNLNNLNFNWKIIMAPMSVIDYIVVHELAHLKYPNHSRDFWGLVEAIIPDYREKQEWLRVNGRQLEI